MKRSPLVLVTALALCGPAAGSAQAASLCVDHRPGCFRELQPAIDAARDGDAIRVGPGVYRGGVTIDVSVALRGAGADRTRIRGGGPVLTLGAPFAPDPPAISISGVTITGGVTTSTEWDTHRAYWAFGGGVYIPPSEGGELGATVTIDRSVVAHNRTAPTVAITPGLNEGCPECPYADAKGGGIFNSGNLTLTRTTVADNRAAGPVTSIPEGGGIVSYGPLTIDRSKVVGNEAHGQPPNGREAAAGGIFADETGLAIRRSVIAGNRAVFESRWPAGETPGALGGGVFVDGDFTLHPGVQATIEQSRIEGNEARAFNPVGDAIAFSGGVQGNGAVAITDSVVSSNRAVATIPPGSTALADGDAAAGNLNVAALIDHVQFTRNSALALAPDGTAITYGGGFSPFADDPLDVRHSSFTDNRITAIGHVVDAAGAGILNNDVLTLHDVDVSGNKVRAFGATGSARGGGISNSRSYNAQEFAPVLSAFDMTVTGNVIAASPGVDVHGGGFFTSEPVTLERVLISRNRPDDGCAGCVAGLSRAASSATGRPASRRALRRPRPSARRSPARRTSARRARDPRGPSRRPARGRG